MRNGIRNVATASALTMGVLAGCSDGGSPETTPTTEPRVELDANEAQLAGRLCVNGFNMETTFDEEFAADNVGGVNSLMNNFTVVNDDGETVPVSEEVFADRVLDEVCKKPTVLASLTAYMIEPAGRGVNGKIAAPDASSQSRVAELANLYRNNESEALRAIQEIASVVKAGEPNDEGMVDGVEREEAFSVIENQGTLIAPQRENGELTGKLETQKITVGELYKGYLFNYVTDDTDLTEKERADLETVRTLVLISDEGQMVIKIWIGDQEVDIDVDEAPETALVSPDVTTGDEVPVDPVTGEPIVTAPANDDPEAEGPTGTDSDTTGPVVTEPTPGDDDSGPEDGQPIDNGCDSDGDPDCEGGEEPGEPTPTTGAPTTTTTTTVRPTTTTTTTVRPTTTTTTPTTTTPPTTTTTVPPTTTTTVRPTTTTTEAPKGSVPPEECNTNPFDNIPDCED